MFCQYCGKEIVEGEEFCSHCGERLKKAPLSKRIYSHELTKLKVLKEKKSPGAAAAIGFFLGWILLGPAGYIYLGQWNWFWITFVVQIFAYPLTLFFAYPVLPVIFAIHQYQMANELNELIVLEHEGIEVKGEAEEDGYASEE